MRTLLIAVGFMYLLTSAPAFAHQDAEFQREVLQRLDRIERELSSRTSSPRAAPVTVETDIYCGGDCIRAAQAYCERMSFQRGVPKRPVVEDGIEKLRQVTCMD